MLIGTFTDDDGRMVEVTCATEESALRLGERAVVTEHRVTVPARQVEAVACERHRRFEDALDVAEAMVLVRGGQLGASAAAMVNARVARPQAEEMFGSALEQYVHVPIARDRRN
jgi:hypothetical protein